jgi:hypothetical protein
MDYNLSNSLESTRQLNLIGNVIPHSWYSHITFENGKTDLIGIVLLAEIIYWYRPTEIKCERTGRLLGYKKKFRADMLQRSNGSFADQFGLTKRQIAEGLKRLEDTGLIHREFRTIETSQGKIGNVQYLAPIVSAITMLDNDPDDNQLIGDDTPSDDDSFIPLSEEKMNVTPPITFKRDRGHIETSKGSRSDVIGIPFERDTYTEITTKITTENTAAACERHWPIAAAAFSKKIEIADTDALIGDVLTPKQLTLIENTARELSSRVNRNPDVFAKELETVILSSTSFTHANRDFFKKLNTIKKMIKERGWQTPAAFIEKKQSEHKKTIDPLKRELNEIELDCAHWEKMVRMSLEKGQSKQAEDFRKLHLQAKSKLESTKHKFESIQA